MTGTNMTANGTGLDDEGRIIVEPVVLTPDADGALQWLGLAK